MLKLISDEEFEMIDDWKCQTAPLDINYVTETPAPIQKVLEPWANAKSQYLNKIFGDNLILEKEVEFTIPPEELEEAMRETVGIDYHSFGLYSARDVNDEIILNIPEEKRFYVLLEKWFDERWDACKDYDHRWEVSKLKGDLLSSWSLVRNRIDRSSIISISPNKTIRIYAGMKVMKVLSLLADELKIPYFEEFRLAHSRVLNTKKLKGTLCLSIHPMDYMTMSDNDNGWSSCMSWAERGCYRQGTIEMMNSESVVVGYLKSKTDMAISHNHSWNSKKWRSLFVVTENFITNIKSYPYSSDDLETACLNWLKELCETNWEKSYYPNLYPYYHNRNITIDKDKDFFVTLNFSTNHMYNDFPHSENLKAYFSTEIESRWYDYYYSGISECIWCGKTNVCFEDGDENLVLCQNCENIIYCDCCDHRIHDNGGCTYELDGDILCEYCYSYNRIIDPLTGEEHDKRKCIKLTLSLDPIDADANVSVYLYRVNAEDLYKFAETYNELSYWDPWYEVTLENLTEEGAQLFKDYLLPEQLEQIRNKRT